MESDIFNFEDMITQFKIYEPTESEILLSKIKQYKRIKITDMNYWYPKYEKYTQKSYKVDLSVDDLDNLLNLEINGRELGFTKDTEIKISKILSKCKDKYFIKLNTRSPKDISNCIVDKNTKISEISNILSNSFRTIEDIYDFSVLQKHDPNKYKCSLYFREFDNDINIDDEYRVYVRDGVVKGICNYNIESVHQVNDYTNIMYDIYEYIQPMVTNEQTLVIDVYAKDKDNIHLLEFNPYGLSNPLVYGSYEKINESTFKLI